jgi:hypothetical protein
MDNRFSGNVGDGIAVAIASKNVDAAGGGGAAGAGFAVVPPSICDWYKNEFNFFVYTPPARAYYRFKNFFCFEIIELISASSSFSSPRCSVNGNAGMLPVI